MATPFWSSLIWRKVNLRFVSPLDFGALLGYGQNRFSEKWIRVKQISAAIAKSLFCCRGKQYYHFYKGGKTHECAFISYWNSLLYHCIKRKVTNRLMNHDIHYNSFRLDWPVHICLFIPNLVRFEHLDLCDSDTKWRHLSMEIM